MTHSSQGEVSLVEQDTIEYGFLAYLNFAKTYIMRLI